MPSRRTFRGILDRTGVSVPNALTMQLLAFVVMQDQLRSA